MTVGPASVRVSLESEAIVEKPGDAMSGARTRGDLDRFRKFIETRENEAGARRCRCAENQTRIHPLPQARHRT
jgi:hypothetical protein